MKAVSIVRNRGQLTIPDSIRKLVKWVAPTSPVSVSVTRSDEIVIRPHNKGYDWDKIWKMVHKSRAIKGKGKGSASEFIIKDRLSH